MKTSSHTQAIPQYNGKTLGMYSTGYMKQKGPIHNNLIISITELSASVVQHASATVTCLFSV